MEITHLLWTAVPVLNHPQCKELFPYAYLEIPLAASCICSVLGFFVVHLKELFDSTHAVISLSLLNNYWSTVKTAISYLMLFKLLPRQTTHVYAIKCDIQWYLHCSHETQMLQPLRFL